MAQVTPVPSLDLDFWLKKAHEWDQTDTLESQKDVCLHLPKLQEFLQHAYETLKHMSPNAAVEQFPPVGQLLGRLCENKFVLGHEETRNALICCLCCLQSSEPKSAVELKANSWVQNLLCHLFCSSEAIGHEEYKSIDKIGCTTVDYHSKLLKNIIASWIKQLTKPEGSNCENKLSGDYVRALSLRCIPILTLPDLVPLLEALLKYHSSEPKEVLDDEFLDRINNAILRKKILLSESAVLSLWLRHLPSLERAVLDLFQRLIAIQSKSLKEMEQIINDSVLAQAAQDPFIFRIIDNIFRNAILESDGNIKVITVVRLFTHLFIHIYQKNNTQVRFPLKAYFPNSDRLLVMALLRQPVGLQQDVCLAHLQSIIRMLSSVAKETRSRESVFESWFLLIHFGDWVDIAAELLMTSECEASDDLLWLLAFYYNPWNENQETSRTMTASRSVYERLLALRSSAAVCASKLQTLLEEEQQSGCHPCTLQLYRHLFIFFLLFSSEWHIAAKEFITHVSGILNIYINTLHKEMQHLLLFVVYRYIVILNG
ncbi:FA complementation group C L homeolog [Xenopus laevis]|uniref:FA complementation group C L homeolog n=1 Tax=Xenopus laevis TaxID=8355 RepID=D2CGM1_XENLA|nr:FA complementation group C L homeolog [Xenopus laevis]ABO31054.1 Fanconi anemia complementation group C [Xenopus laevis]